MEFTKWLDAERGRAKRLADHFGVAKSAIWGWKVNGVPVKHMKKVCALSGGEVSLEDMVPGPVSVNQE